MFQHRGFTIIEIIITVSVFLIIAGVSVPLFFKFQEFSEKESIKQEVLQSLREIQMQALLGADNNNHGIYFSGHNYTTYTGTSFASKVANSDQLFELSNIISANANTDINFEKNTGVPTQDTELFLLNDLSETETTLTVSIIGLIE